jgi:hypothetical protein
MLGGIVAMFVIALPFVTLALAASILVGIVFVAVAGKRAESRAEIALGVPKAEGLECADTI